MTDWSINFGLMCCSDVQAIQQSIERNEFKRMYTTKKKILQFIAHSSEILKVDSDNWVTYFSEFIKYQWNEEIKKERKEGTLLFFTPSILLMWSTIVNILSALLHHCEPWSNQTKKKIKFNLINVEEIMSRNARYNIIAH